MVDLVRVNTQNFVKRKPEYDTTRTDVPGLPRSHPTKTLPCMRISVLPGVRDSGSVGGKVGPVDCHCRHQRAFPMSGHVWTVKGP